MRALRPAARGRARDQGGMTIVELLVALVVSIIGLAGLLSLFTVASRANAVSADTSQAVDVAAQMLEDFRTMTIADIEGNAAYGPIDADGWGPVAYHLGDVTGRRGIEFQRNVSARQVFGSPGLVWIQAEVVWQDPGAAQGPPRSVVLETTLLREVAP